MSPIVEQQDDDQHDGDCPMSQRDIPLDGRISTRWEWAGENMLWGGTLGWQTECKYGCVLVTINGSVTTINPRAVTWSPDWQPL